jgi:hypothetical protein
MNHINIALMYQMNRRPTLYLEFNAFFIKKIIVI